MLYIYYNTLRQICQGVFKFYKQKEVTINMAFTKHTILEKAVEITKDAAKGGTDKHLSIILTEVYNKLIELNEDVKKEE